MFFGSGAYVSSAGSYCFYSLAVFPTVRAFRSLVLVVVRSLVEGGGRESPGVRVTFLCFAKRKSPKKRRPCCLRPLRFAAGQPGVLGCGVRRGTHCAPAALRSNNHGESVDEAGMSCGTPATPRPARPRRIQKGWGANSPSGRRCARPGVLGAQGARVGGRAQRWPVWLSGFGFPSGCAEERKARRIRDRACLSRRRVCTRHRLD